MSFLPYGNVYDIFFGLFLSPEGLLCYTIYRYCIIVEMHSESKMQAPEPKMGGHVMYASPPKMGI